MTTDSPRRLFHPALALPGWVVVLASALLIGGCTQVAPATTPTPTAALVPTPTPVPTSAPTLAPSPELRLRSFEPDFDPAPEAEKLAQILRLLSLAPADHDNFYFADLREIQENPEIAQLLQLENPLFAPAVPQAASGQVDWLMLAMRNEDEGTLAALEGTLGLEAFLQLATSRGAVVEPQPEKHRSYEIWKGDLFSLASLYLAELDQSTVLLSSESNFSAEYSSARLREALDSADELKTHAAADAETLTLMRGLPTGLITALSKDCPSLKTDLPLGQQSLPNCRGVGLTATVSEDDMLEVHVLLHFDRAEQAGEALANAERLMMILGGSESPIDEVNLRQEGQLIRVRASGGAQEMLSRLMSGIMRLGEVP